MGTGAAVHDEEAVAKCAGPLVLPHITPTEDRRVSTLWRNVIRTASASLLCAIFRQRHSCSWCRWAAWHADRVKNSNQTGSVVIPSTIRAQILRPAGQGLPRPLLARTHLLCRLSTARVLVSAKRPTTMGYVHPEAMPREQRLLGHVAVVAVLEVFGSRLVRTTLLGIFTLADVSRPEQKP